MPPAGAPSLTHPSVGVCFLHLVLPRPRRLCLSPEAPRLGRPLKRGFFFDPSLPDANISVAWSPDPGNSRPRDGRAQRIERGSPVTTLAGLSSLRRPVILFGSRPCDAEQEQAAKRSPCESPSGASSLPDVIALTELQGAKSVSYGTHEVVLRFLGIKLPPIQETSG